MNNRLRKKISLLTSLTCWDHHKTRDGIYEITYTFSAWDEKGHWYILHPGYLWNTDKEQGQYETFEEAEIALEKCCDTEFKSQVEWFRSYWQEDPSTYDVPPPPIERINEAIAEYERLM